MFRYSSYVSNSRQSSLLNDRNDIDNEGLNNDMDNEGLSNNMDIDNNEKSARSDQCSDVTDISTNLNGLILRFSSKFYANHSFVQELMIDVKEFLAEFLTIMKLVINENDI